jgi:hypothetical protein
MEGMEAVRRNMFVPTTALFPEKVKPESVMWRTDEVVEKYIPPPFTPSQFFISVDVTFTLLVPVCVTCNPPPFPFVASADSIKEEDNSNDVKPDASIPEQSSLAFVENPIVSLFNDTVPPVMTTKGDVRVVREDGPGLRVQDVMVNDPVDSIKEAV